MLIPKPEWWRMERMWSGTKMLYECLRWATKDEQSPLLLSWEETQPSQGSMAQVCRTTHLTYKLIGSSIKKNHLKPVSFRMVCSMIINNRYRKYPRKWVLWVTSQCLILKLSWASTTQKLFVMKCSLNAWVWYMYLAWLPEIRGIVHCLCWLGIAPPSCRMW